MLTDGYHFKLIFIKCLITYFNSFKMTKSRHNYSLWPKMKEASGIVHQKSVIYVQEKNN